MFDEGLSWEDDKKVLAWMENKVGRGRRREDVGWGGHTARSMAAWACHARGATREDGS